MPTLLAISHRFCLLLHMTRLCIISKFSFVVVSLGCPAHLSACGVTPTPKFNSPFLHCALRRRLLSKGSWISLGGILFLQRYFMTAQTSVLSILSHTLLFTVIFHSNQKDWLNCPKTYAHFADYKKGTCSQGLQRTFWSDLVFRSKVTLVIMILFWIHFKNGPQNCICYIENDNKWSFFYMVYTFLFGYNMVIELPKLCFWIPREMLEKGWDVNIMVLQVSHFYRDGELLAGFSLVCKNAELVP